MNIIFIMLGFIIQTQTSQLFYLAQLFRHGARYPVYPYYDYNQTLSLAGQLTEVGMRQHYNLGTYLRRDYIQKNSFLNRSYDQNQIYIVSTQYRRTIGSAFSQLYGLYPLGTGPQILDNIDPNNLIPPYGNDSYQNSQFALPQGFQTIAVGNGEAFLENCYNYKFWQQQMINQNIVRYTQISNEYYEFFLKLKAIFQLKDQDLNLITLSKVYDTIICDKYLGRQLPKEFSKQDLLNFRHLNFYYFLMVHSGLYSQILSTALFQQIIANFDKKINNLSNPEKISFFSGHDTNVSPTITFLNFTSFQCIQDKWKKNSLQKYLNCEQGADFASNIIFQLYKQDEQITIKIMYNGKYMNLCERKSTECDYYEWKNRVESKYVDFEKLCQI